MGNMFVNCRLCDEGWLKDLCGYFACAVLCSLSNL